jgi:hypothetical protein
VAGSCIRTSDACTARSDCAATANGSTIRWIDRGISQVDGATAVTGCAARASGGVTLGELLCDVRRALVPPAD